MLNMTVMIIFAVSVVLTVIIKLLINKKSKKQLGKMLLDTSSTLNKEFWINTVFKFIFSFTVAIYLLTRDNISQVGLYALAVLIGFICANSVIPIIMALSKEKIGIYEQGVNTLYGKKFYSDIKHYDVAESRLEGRATAIFYPNRMLGMGAYSFSINLDKVKKLHKVLVNRCEYYELDSNHHTEIYKAKKEMRQLKREMKQKNKKS